MTQENMYRLFKAEADNQEFNHLLKKFFDLRVEFNLLDSSDEDKALELTYRCHEVNKQMEDFKMAHERNLFSNNQHNLNWLLILRKPIKERVREQILKATDIDTFIQDYHLLEGIDYTILKNDNRILKFLFLVLFVFVFAGMAITFLSNHKGLMINLGIGMIATGGIIIALCTFTLMSRAYKIANNT